MAELTFYERLLELPLFQGLGCEDLTHLLEVIKIDLRKFPPSRTVLQVGEPCNAVWFLLRGRVDATRTSGNGAIRFIESLTPPSVIGTETLFGLNQQFDCTVQTTEASEFLVVPKEAVVNHMMAYKVCQLNLVNLLSTRLHRSLLRSREKPSADTARRLVLFLLRHLGTPGGRKVVWGRMTDLAEYLQVSRLNLSDTLNALQERGLIELGRKHFIIPRMEALLSM